jgi:hypothetical protein
MIKNLYYRDTFARHNAVKLLFLSFCSLFVSYPRMLIEVFTRKNFGERYFSLSSAFILTLMLACAPVAISHITSGWGSSEMATENYSYDDSFGDVVQQTQTIEPATQGGIFPDYIGWYLYLAVFLGFCIKHYIDNRRSPSAFNFNRFTLSSGVVHPFFRNINIGGLSPDIRFFECYLEPAIFLGAGILLALIGQTLGWLLIVSSFFYSMSYITAYISGDNFVMDKIDEIICNEELEKAFVEDGDLDETKGFQFRGSKPNTEAMRRQILPLMTEETVVEASQPENLIASKNALDATAVEGVSGVK